MPTEAEQSIDAFHHYYTHPVIIAQKKSLWKSIWDKDEKSVLGRTASSWSEYEIMMNSNPFAAKYEYSDASFESYLA